MCLAAGLDPLPVEIGPEQIAPVVAVDDSVDVQHRDDLEHEVLSQLPSYGVVTQQKVHDVFYEVAYLRLAGVHSRR